MDSQKGKQQLGETLKRWSGRSRKRGRINVSREKTEKRNRYRQRMGENRGELPKTQGEIGGRVGGERGTTKPGRD